MNIVYYCSSKIIICSLKKCVIEEKMCKMELCSKYIVIITETQIIYGATMNNKYCQPDHTYQLPLFDREEISLSKPTIVLSYGMGVESTAILLRWVLEPTSRDFDLDKLVVLTAMTGDEFSDTGRLVNEYILPILRNRSIRFVQVARAGAKTEDGIVVLDDSLAPKKVFLKGAYKLSDELFNAATIPQISGKRLCSLKFKGFVLDEWVKQTIGTSNYRHIIGFNAGEIDRIERDQCYGGSNRETEYPLLEWGWNREHCEQFIKRVFNIDWPKSCCAECPFTQGKPLVLLRFRRQTEAAVRALMLEGLALAFNPKQRLYGKKSLLDCLQKDGNQAAIERYYKHLDRCDWALYRVRRIYFSKACAWRKVEIISQGKRKAITATINQWPNNDRSFEIDERFIRCSLKPPEDIYPTSEEVIVAAPVGAKNKSRPHFEEKWLSINSQSKLAA
ncbi:MAG: hypothetical protein AB1489_41280 [Acidobacteriota bacterium]